MSLSLSSNQFGSETAPPPPRMPLSLSAANSSTFQRQTVWRSPHATSQEDSGMPLSYSAKTAGSVMNFDDSHSNPFEKK